jgi:hypothetical protein
MRALCGAIITAGALIGLGLWSIGVGQRYAGYPYLDPESRDPQWVLLRNLDTSLMVSLVALLCLTAIGLGIAILGLAYHHHRRHHEMLHRQRQAAASANRVATPGTPPASERVTL